jgi:hypothetical protein
MAARPHGGDGAHGHINAMTMKSAILQLYAAQFEKSTRLFVYLKRKSLLS